MHVNESIGNLEDGFIRIDKDIQKITRQNSVCHIIEELWKARDPLLLKEGYDCRILNQSAKKKIIFNIPTPPPHLLFTKEGYTFKERHLRVDYEYSLPGTFRGESGLTAAHYTEVYTKEKSEESIIVHLYYSTKGRYIQIKKKTLGEELPEVPDSLLEQMIHHNGLQPLSFYEKLVDKRNEKYLGFLKAADANESEISTLSRKLNTVSKIREYINKLELFCSQIKQLNLYNELKKDVRDIISLKSIEVFRKKLQFVEQQEAHSGAKLSSVKQGSLSQKNKKTTGKKTSGSKVKTKNQAKRVQQSALPNLLENAEWDTKLPDEIMQQLSEIENRFLESLKDQSPDSIFRRYSLINEFNIFYLTNNAYPDSEFQLLLNKLDKQIQAVEELSLLLKKEAVAGNSALPIRLLPLLRSDEQRAVFVEIFNKLAESEVDDSGEVAKSLRVICEFAFNNVECYEPTLRMYLKMLKLYDVKWQGGAIALSFHFGLLYHDKKDTFSFFLNQGSAANNVGAVLSNVSFSLLQSVVWFSKSPAYIESLLKHGAVVDAPRQRVDKFIGKEQLLRIEKNQNVRGHKKPWFQEQDSDEKYINYADMPTVRLAYELGHYILIPALLPYSRLENIVFILAKELSSPQMRARQIEFSKCSGVHFCHAGTIDQVTQEMALDDVQGIKELHVSLLFYQTPENQEQAICLSALTNWFNTFCQNHLNDQNVYTYIQNTAPLLNNNLHYLFNANRLLLCSVPNPSLNVRQYLMREIYMYASKIIKLNAQVAVTYLKSAVKLADHSKVLRDSPTFKALKNTLQKMGVHIVDLEDEEITEQLRKDDTASKSRTSSPKRR